MCHSLIGLISHDHMPSPSMLVLYWCINMHNWVFKLFYGFFFPVQSQNWAHWWTGLLDTHYLLIYIFTFRIFFTVWSKVLDDPDEVHRSKNVSNTAVLYTTNITGDETYLVLKNCPLQPDSMSFQIEQQPKRVTKYNHNTGISSTPNMSIQSSSKNFGHNPVHNYCSFYTDLFWPL